MIVFYGAVIVAKATRVHPVRMMNMERHQAAADRQPRPNRPGLWAVSSPVGCL